jgi:hypothetical protein
MTPSIALRTVPISLLPTVTALSARTPEPTYDIVAFDDGTLRVRGCLPPLVRESLLLTHVEGGHDRQGRAIWYPKEAPDAA